MAVKSVAIEVAPGRESPGVKPRLALELIPRGQGNLNLRHALLDTDWRTLRKQVIAKAQSRCEVCGCESRSLHCHEVWEFDDNAYVQKLTGLKALCAPCHDATHLYQETFGLKDYRNAEKHLMRVNGWSWKQTKAYIDLEVSRNARRNDEYYRIDLSYARRLGLKCISFYDATLSDHDDNGDEEIDKLATTAWKRSRKRLVAIFRPRHVDCLRLFWITPWTRSRRQRELFLSAFSRMRHRWGTLIGIYDSRATLESISADIAGYVERHGAGLAHYLERSQS